MIARSPSIACTRAPLMHGHPRPVPCPRRPPSRPWAPFPSRLEYVTRQSSRSSAIGSPGSTVDGGPAVRACDDAAHHHIGLSVRNKYPEFISLLRLHHLSDRTPVYLRVCAQVQLSERGMAESRQRRWQLARIGQPVPCFPQIAIPAPAPVPSGPIRVRVPHGCVGAEGVRTRRPQCIPGRGTWLKAGTIAPSRSQHRHHESALLFASHQQPPHCRPASVAAQGTRRVGRRLSHTHVGCAHPCRTRGLGTFQHCIRASVHSSEGQPEHTGTVPCRRVMKHVV